MTNVRTRTTIMIKKVESQDVKETRQGWLWNCELEMI